ncbi:MAG: hypothetical protein ACOCZQ_03245 [Nanoarchaeota archaeon]
MFDAKEKLEEGEKAKEKKTCPSKIKRTKKQKKEDKDNLRRGILFLAIITISLVVLFAVLAFAPKFIDQELLPGPTPETYEYNGFTFTEIDGGWQTKGHRGNSEFEISLRHGPKELENITVEGNIPQFRDSGDFYYITIDPRDENHDEYVTMSMAELAPNLALHFQKEVQSACTVEHEACHKEGAPVKTCNDTDRPMVYLKREPGAKIEISDGCAVIQGKGNEMVKAADRFMYGMYGIM